MFRRIDWLLLGLAVGLTLFGLAMIASVSVFQSYQLTQKLVDAGQLAAPYNSFYLWRSVIHVLVSFGALGIGAVIPYRVWERHARTLFLITTAMLVAVLALTQLRNNYGTASSWLVLGGVSIQPSEILKLTLVFYLAVWLQKREQLIGTFKEGFIPFAALLLLSTFLVAIEPDLGGFLVLSCIACVMFFIAGGNVGHLLLGGGMASVLGLPVILRQDYVWRRFSVFLSASKDPTVNEKAGYQITQALIALGSGRLFGVGYGKSIQKFGYLPEVQGDMIFSVMGEELGFFRLLIILAMYALFIMRGYKIAREAPDRFGFLLATGITTWVACQTLVNIFVNLSLFPLTGMTLPFISYGGSSLITMMFAVGILLNISMNSTQEALAVRKTKRRVSLAFRR